MAAPSALADDRAKAKRHFDTGLLLLEAEDFDAAEAEFAQSVKLFPSRGGIYNLANCHRALHRYAEAMAGFERLLERYEGELSPEMREDAERQLRELANLIAVLSVEVNRSGATIFVDGDKKGVSPLGAPLRLGPGSHNIAAELDGYERREKTVTLVSGKEANVRLELQPMSGPHLPEAEPEETAPPAMPPPQPEKPQGTNSLKIVGITTVAVGVATAVAGGVTGVLALKKDGELANDCPGGECTEENWDEKDSLDRLTTTTNFLLIGGGVVAATGAVLFIVSLKDKEHADEIGFSPILTPLFAGGTLTGRF